MKFVGILTFILLPYSLFGGDVTGKILYEGAPPKLVRIPMSADPYCLSQHKEPVNSEQIVVNKNGTLEYVLVSIKEGLGSKTFPPPSTAAVLSQKGCMYTPHVMGVQTDQEFDVINNDSTVHNVHTLSKLNPAFNIAQPVTGMKIARKLSKPEVFLVKCEIHRWMSAYVGVFSHPFFNVSNETGTYTLKGIPAGNYTIEAWHEKLGTQTAKVTVGASDVKTVDFRFKGQ